MSNDKPKNFVLTVSWQEKNGSENGSIKGREVSPEQLAAIQAALFSADPKGKQNEITPNP